MISKYKTIHILLINVHLDCKGEGSSNRNASRDESVETGDESFKTRDESIKAKEKKTQQYSYNKGLRLDLQEFIVTMHEGMCETGSPVQGFRIS